MYKTLWKSSKSKSLSFVKYTLTIWIPDQFANIMGDIVVQQKIIDIRKLDGIKTCYGRQDYGTETFNNPTPDGYWTLKLTIKARTQEIAADAMAELVALIRQLTPYQEAERLHELKREKKHAL